MDVAIIDTPWNGVAESLKIAAMADAYEINVAPHNFYGHLATMMNAHFCALVPNFRIMEIDPDTVPWCDELVTIKPRIESGYLVVPDGPGWGTEVDEEAVRAHPPRSRAAPARHGDDALGTVGGPNMAPRMQGLRTAAPVPREKAAPGLARAVAFRPETANNPA